MRVTVPAAIQPEWVGEPSKECQDGYNDYYRNIKLAAESEGWTSWVCQRVARYSFGLLQFGSAVALGNTAAFTAGVVTRNEMPYQVAGKVAQAAHGLHVQKTRKPIEHARVSEVVLKLYQIKDCDNGHEFIDRLLTVYTKAYLASAASYNLKQTLASPAVDLAEKIDQIVLYLVRVATLKGCEKLFYNNGKDFFTKIVILAENTKIEA